MYLEIGKQFLFVKKKKKRISKDSKQAVRWGLGLVRCRDQ